MLVAKAACLFGAALLIAGTASSLLQQALAQPQPAAAPSVGGQSAGMPEPLTVSTASLAQEAASAALLRFGPAITASNGTVQTLGV
jgi:hypothetical protein